MTVISAAKYKKIEKVTKSITIYFALFWALFSFGSSILYNLNGLVLIGSIAFGFLPYLFVYNSYVRGTLSKKVEQSGTDRSQ